ncbi:hypothetical protein ACFP3U_24770 [Kitasatospora misakiensis]|uniref:Uncharacterized protein n=1 Tax=Kitasatospora misakiensis TaxID=67330 RepID=A0ABW0XCZ3_9ACTN
MTDRKVLRRALSCWAFNFSEHLAEPPEEITSALTWVTKKSIPLGQLEDSENVRRGLEAIARLMDGSLAADTTLTRKWMVFNNALRYAGPRAAGGRRAVPIPPVLVQLVREHVAAYGVAPDGRLLTKFYAKIINGRQEQANSKVERCGEPAE